MAVLVGIYLVEGDAFEVVRGGQASWAGTWNLFRSPQLNRADWEFLTGGEVAALYPTRAQAEDAGRGEGVALARMLQGDDGLEPVVWTSAPATASAPAEQTAVGWR